MGRYLDIAHTVAGNEINELNEISPSPEINADPVEAQTGQGLHTREDHRSSIADPTVPCPICDSGQWWQLPGQPWHCRECRPLSDAENRRATTLTLPCHEVRTRSVRNPARLRRMVESACRGLRLKPEQLWQELEANGDLADFESDVSAKRLRQTAMTLAVRRATL